MKVEGFSLYTYNKGSVYKGNELIKPTSTTARPNALRYKIKSDTGEWKVISLSRIKSIVGDVLRLPKKATVIKGTDDKYFITPKGRVFSFSAMNPNGIELRAENGGEYLNVRILLNGIRGSIGVHRLVAYTFLGLDLDDSDSVVMHKDNNKLNNKKKNLKIGTFSDNNQQAWDDGLKPRRYNV